MNVKLPADVGDKVDRLLNLFDGQIIGASEGEDIRFHLFHAANSICAQKVRSVIFELQLPFVSHVMNLSAGDSYVPDYVLARIQACRRAGHGFVTTHNGSTSVQEVGCDPCVVPTVVDLSENRVLVDSLAICHRLIEVSRPKGSGLLPIEYAVELEKQLRIADSLPNYQLLGDKVVPVTSRVENPNNGFALRKVARCDELIDLHRGNKDLVDAYQAKRSKEQSAANKLFAVAELSLAREQMRAAFSELEAVLIRSSYRFIFGNALTLADIFWGVELIRAVDLNMSPFAEHGDNKRLAEYYCSICQEPAIQKAVLEWPGSRLGSMEK